MNCNTTHYRANSSSVPGDPTLYHLPDHPKLLQEFIWQELDLAPRFPVLAKFLRFWEKNLDGKLHSVKVAHCQLVKPAEIRTVGGKFYLN